MLLRVKKKKVIWIQSANVLFLSVILKVLLGPLEIHVIQFSVCMVKSIRLLSMNCRCLHGTKYTFRNVMWQISKCDDQFYTFY